MNANLPYLTKSFDEMSCMELQPQADRESCQPEHHSIKKDEKKKEEKKWKHKQKLRHMQWIHFQYANNNKHTNTGALMLDGLHTSISICMYLHMYVYTDRPRESQYQKA